MQNMTKIVLGWVMVLIMALHCQAADLKQRKVVSPTQETQAAPVTPARKPLAPSPLPYPPAAATGTRTVSGFDFSATPQAGNTGIRTASGLDFSIQPLPGSTGIRTVKGFDFSTQASPGTTGIRTVQDMDFIKQ